MRETAHAHKKFIACCVANGCFTDMAAQVDSAGAREEGETLELVETPLETIVEVCVQNSMTSLLMRCSWRTYIMRCFWLKR